MGSFGAVVGATIEDTDEDLADQRSAARARHRRPGRHGRRRTPHLRRRPRPGAARRARGRSSSAGPDAGPLHDAVGRSVDAFARAAGRPMRARLRAASSWGSPWPCCCPLTGCGGNEYDAYCGDLSGTEGDVGDDRLRLPVGPAEPPADAARPRRQVPEGPRRTSGRPSSAPSTTCEKALKDAGVKPSEFEDGKPPAGSERGRPPGDHRRRRRRSPPTRSSQAANGIEQEGRDVCKVNLGL